jgi:hypothetical protein
MQLWDRSGVVGWQPGAWQLVTPGILSGPGFIRRYSSTVQELMTAVAGRQFLCLDGDSGGGRRIIVDMTDRAVTVVWWRRTSRRRLVVAIMIVLAALAGVLTAVGRAVAHQSYTVQMKVQCLGGGSPQGVWIDRVNGGGAFALAHDVDVSDGWGWTRYSAEMPDGGSYRLNIGCPGIPFVTGKPIGSKDWAVVTHSDTLGAESLDVICNDIPPWVMDLGDWASEKVSLVYEIVMKAFGEAAKDVKYGQCRAEQQIAPLAAKPSLTSPPPVVQPAVSSPTADPKTSAPSPPLAQPPTVVQPIPATSDEQPPVVPPAQTWTGVIYNNAVFAVRVRSGPGTSYSPVESYPAGGGQAVTVLCVTNGEHWADPTGNPSGTTWYHVTNGYIATGYVNVGGATVSTCG